EYVDGLDLAAMLRKFKDEKRPVPLPAAFHVAIEIIRALDFAHGHNVVHRDVSPSNVLVSRAGEVKIADFGIAVAAQPHRISAPGPKKVMGKWRYMSPEQARGDTLDTRSDLFSAASVIYELFTNEKLFPGDEAEEIIKNINEMPIPKMAAIRPGLPSRLDEVIGAALARKPIDRPTRPATVLRQLIELSYESSIMATALDVAEALATVIPAKRPDGRGALDDVIRKQLHEQSVMRQTAVTDGKPPSTQTSAKTDIKGEHSTGLFRKLDMDGVSRLEEVDVVEATRVSAPRAKRNSEQGVAMPGDTDLHALYDATKDKDRHTEVGGPPTGQVAKVGQSVTGIPKQPPAKTAVPAPRRTWLVMALLLLVVGGIGAFVLTRTPAGSNVVATGSDAGVVTRLTIDPSPEGASGFIELAGDPSSRKAIPKLTHKGPFSAEVRPNEQYHYHLELPGYSPLDETARITPGENLRLEPKLATAPAKLHVVTDPPGAAIALGGRQLGDSPKLIDNLTPATGLVLTLTKQGFTTVTRPIDLVAGETAEINEPLKATEKFAMVTIDVVGAVWGEVSYNGKYYGRNNTLAGGFTVFRFPTGRGQLTVTHPPTKRKKSIPITVTEGTKSFTVKLD
ncbi:MAG: serine/threonine-protein kinase, partial [Kofleriaceae bacterium]